MSSDAAAASWEQILHEIGQARAAYENVRKELDAVVKERDALLAERDPLRGGRPQIATKEDIYYCFRLILGRDPHPEEWPGHSARAGQDLANVVSSYLTSRGFAARGLLSKSYTDAVDLIELPSFRMYAAKNDLAVGRHVQRGVYEPHVTAVFQRYVKPGMSVLDIGANIGYFTMTAAALVGPTGRVFAVEPNPENVKLIEASRRANGFGNVVIVQAAAGRKLSILALNVSHSNGMTTDMFEPIAQVLASHPVACVELDSVLPQDTTIDFLKIDVEGAELNSLIGLTTTISRHRPTIVSEFGPRGLLSVSGCTGIEYLQFLINKGYQISVIEPNGSEKGLGTDAASVMEEYQRAIGDHIDILATSRPPN